MIHCARAGRRLSSAAAILLGGLLFARCAEATPVTVVADSIVAGSVLAPGAVTDTVTFSKEINPNDTSSSDIELHAVNEATNIVPVSFSFDATNTILTVNYPSLAVDDYIFTLVASGFVGLLDGQPMSSNYTKDFCVSNTATCPAVRGNVPEPLTLLLFGAGLGGTAIRRRRKV